MKPVLFFCLALVCLSGLVFSAPAPFGTLSLAVPVISVAAADATLLGLGALAAKKTLLLGAAVGAAAANRG